MCILLHATCQPILPSTQKVYNSWPPRVLLTFILGHVCFIGKCPFFILTQLQPILTHFSPSSKKEINFNQLQLTSTHFNLLLLIYLLGYFNSKIVVDKWIKQVEFKNIMSSLLEEWALFMAQGRHKLEGLVNGLLYPRREVYSFPIRRCHPSRRDHHAVTHYDSSYHYISRTLSV